MEVIVVDDRSRDRTFKLVERFIRERNLDNFRVISLRLLGLRGTKKNAIRYGVLDAKGELVVVTDADCTPGPCWLKAFSREFRSSGVTMLAGPVLLEPLKGFTGAFQEMEFLSLVGSGAGAAAVGMPVFCNGANMAFRRSAFSEVGGFKGNEKYASGDDVFLLHKIKKRYGARAVRFVFDREAVIYTKGKESWKEFLEQRIRWASKARGYKDLFTRTMTISVFLINLILFLLLFAGLLKPVFLAFFAGLLGMKMIPDLVILLGITGFAGRRRLMWWFPLFEVVYIPYVIYTGIQSLFSGGTWKGRKIITPKSPKGDLTIDG
jgi:cellulose synthase/poly-beta-1,6-N-acetylglucosamine synthase-like glycosyltransferase